MNRGHGYARGASAFQRPENALKRAEELQKVGQKTAAVLALHDVLTSRRHRAWNKGLEEIVFRFIDLCVEERMGRYAKEALMQYRNTCQNVNINSLEEVIKYLLRKATEKAEEAQAKADAAIADLDDLEQERSPEDLMLSYVSDKSNKDRADRELVAPWFKFLWETYRNILEILRNNIKFTTMYGMVTKQAFQFCLQYQRNTEFRRLCEILRNQLLTLKKNRDNRDGRDNRDRPDLANPDTLNQCLETRFEQLTVACQLEMWQEAFRSIEDIHGLWALKAHKTKKELRAQYFACLTQIFSKSGSHCYHAYSWYQLFLLAKKGLGLQEADQQHLASAVLLSTLAIEPYDRRGPETMGEHVRADRTSRIVDILGFNHDPNRAAGEMLSRTNLLTELRRQNILAQVPPDIAAIFRCLEQDRDPLNLCKTVAPYLAKLENQTVSLSPGAPVATIDHHQHLSSLKAVAVLKMMRQLSTAYSVMRIDSVAALIPFMPFSEVEAVLSDAVKFSYVHVYIDHRSATLHLGGPQLRSDGMSAHLSTVAARLAGALTAIQPEALLAAHAARRAETAAAARASAGQLHEDMLARKVLIERRKEARERAREEAEREEEEKRRAEQAAREQEEAARRAEEAKRREVERLQREIAEAEAEEVRKLLREKGIAVKDGEVLNKRELQQKEFERKTREQAEFEAKMLKLSRNMDHMERARREEEAPLLEAQMAERAAAHREYFEKAQDAALSSHRAKWERDLPEKHRTARLADDKEAFKEKVSQRRAAEMARLRAEAERKRREIQQARRAERIKAAKQEYIERCKAELEEMYAEVKAKAEQQAKEAAVREKAERLEAARARKEAEAKAEEERLAALRAKYAAEGGSKGGDAAAPAAAPAKPAAAAEAKPAKEPYRPPVSGGGAYRPPARGDAAASGGSYAPPGRDGGGGGGAYRAPAARPTPYRTGAGFAGGTVDGQPVQRPPGGGRPLPKEERAPPPQTRAAPAPVREEEKAAAAPAPKKGGYVPPHLRGKGA